MLKKKRVGKLSPYLGGGFKYFSCSPLFGEDVHPFWRATYKGFCCGCPLTTIFVDLSLVIPIYNHGFFHRVCWVAGVITRCFFVASFSLFQTRCRSIQRPAPCCGCWVPTLLHEGHGPQGALRSPYPLHHTSRFGKRLLRWINIYICIYFQYLDILTIYMNYHLFKHPGVFSQDLHMVMSYQKIVLDEIACWKNNSHPTQQSRRILSSKDFRSPCSCGITPNHHFCGKLFFLKWPVILDIPCRWINRQPLE